MIKLSEKHREELLVFLRKDPVVNLFLIGDLGLYGFDDTVQEYFGWFEEDILKAVLFRYRDQGIHLNAEMLPNDEIEWIQSYVTQNPCTDFLMGDKTCRVVNNRLDVLFQNIKEMKLATYKPLDSIDISNVIRLDPSAAQDMLDIQVEAFGGNRQKSDSVAQQLKDETLVAYGLYEGSTLVSVANYTAQTQDAAMIIGVATLNDHREKGYASLVVKKMSDDLYAQGLIPVLFYDNPKAARIYERMGYAYYDAYFMNELKK